MIRRNNKRLYESIMKDIAKTVKRHLNESNNGIKVWPKEKLTPNDILSTNEKDVYKCQFFIDLYKAFKKYEILEDYPTIKPNSLLLITAKYYNQGNRSYAEFYFDDDELESNFGLEYEYDIEESIYDYCDKINFRRLI